MSTPGGWGSAGCPRSLAELLAGAAQAYGEAPAILRADGSRTSFAQLEHDAAAVARALADAGAPRDALVRVALDDAALFPAAFYGVALAGCTAVLCPLPAGEKPLYCLDAATMRAILAPGPVDGALLRAARGLGAETGRRWWRSPRRTPWSRTSPKRAGVSPASWAALVRWATPRP